MSKIVKKPEVRRQEIVTAAKELFIEKDYHTSTMQDVMNRLDIAKGTIYHYFKSKEELLEAVVEELSETYLNSVKDKFSKSKGKALKRMQALMEAGISSDDKLLEQLHRPGNIDLHTRLLAVTISKLAPLYAEVIEQGCDEGVFDVKHPLESAELLLAGIQFLTDIGCYPWKEEDLQRRQAAIPSLVEAQLHATKGTFNFLTRR